MTSNTNHNDSSEPASGNATSETKKMSEVLPLVTRRLQQQGVVRVHARYEGEQIMFAFLGADDLPRGSISIVTSVLEISRVFASLLEGRYPGEGKRENVSGFFRWDLNADTLEHEHTVTHHGL